MATRIEAEYTDRLAHALSRGYAAHNPLDDDLSGWPVDIIDVVQAVCRLWHLRPPQNKKQKAHWIQQARALKDATGEFGVQVIEIYREEFEAYMASHGGVAMHPVCGPGSLVNMVRDCAGRLRAGAVVDKKQNPGYYLEDIYADYTEH